MILASFLLAMQPVPPSQVADGPIFTPWPDPEREMPQGDVVIREVDDSEARRTMARFAECVVATSPEKVGEVLVRDFRTSEYRNGLRNLSRDNEGCARKVGLSGRMRMGNLPFAGALAEQMLERDSQPLLTRLSMAALGPASETYSWTDGVAMCMARGAPHMVAAALTTEIASEAERTAIAELQPVTNICAGGEGRLSTTDLGLRSMLATATYRLLAVQKAESNA